MSLLKPYTIIFTWNDYDEKALNLQQEILSITGQCQVISSHESTKVPYSDWIYIGEESYYTKQWNVALQLFKNNRSYNTLVQIQADASCEDWKYFYECLETSYNRFKWGVYSPYVDWSGHYPPTDFIEHSCGYRSIKRTDCTVWAIHETILLQGIDKFDESNIYGWGIDKYYNDLSIKSNREIILDYNICISHPKGSNYDHDAAKEQSEIFTKEIEKPIKISLCTTCCNRIEDFKYTLPHNLKFIGNYNKPIEWVIVDYGSTDENELKDLVSSIERPSNLEIVFIRSNENWNICRAKKLAHDSTTGDILINIDADNFIGISYLEMIHQTVSENLLSLIYYEWDDNLKNLHDNGLDLGFMGKIAISKGIYKSIGGYTTDLHGYGGDDTDLIHRAVLLPINKVTLNDKMKYWTKTIPTVDQETIENNLVENRINHNVLSEKHESRKLLPEHIRYKSVDIINNIDSYDDECIYELYDSITNEKDINDSLSAWARVKGNKLKTIIIEKLWSRDNIRPSFRTLNDLDEWLSIQLNELYNHNISKEYIRNKYHHIQPILNDKITEFVIVTSLSTKINHLITQPSCLKTWKSAGLTIYSVNTTEEIELLQNTYQEVDHWIECNDLSTMFKKPSQKINTLLNVSIDINKPIILINSDIEINGTIDQLNKFPGIGIRNNYDKWKHKSSLEIEGIDIFLITPDIAEKISQTEFAIGRPFWDYWLAYELDMNVKNIHIVTNTFYHKNHNIQWNKDECKIGFDYMINTHQIQEHYNWLKWRISKGYTVWNQ